MLKSVAMTARAAGVSTKLRALLAAGVIFASGCGEGAQTASTEPETTSESDIEADLIEDGRAVAEAQCSRCHAVGREGESPRADAPPLRVVLANYDPEALGENLREGIAVAHPAEGDEMPVFEFNPRGVDALLAYLQSIQEGAG